MTVPSCPKCRGSMTEGFVLDRQHHSTLTQETWIEGAPERSFWRGLKLKGKAQYPVVAFRCSSCGYVEHYARKAER